MKNHNENVLGLNDDKIIALYFKRDERAIKETERKYGRLLSHMAFSILKDTEDCKECCNDAYLGIWNAIPPAKPKSLKAFCVTILRRIAINRYKERSLKRRVPSALTTSMEELERVLHCEETVEQALEAKQLGEAINAYVQGLSERDQYIFIGRYYFARSAEDLAAVCKVTKSAIYKELTKLKLGLKEYLEGRDIHI